MRSALFGLLFRLSCPPAPTVFPPFAGSLTESLPKAGSLSDAERHLGGLTDSESRYSGSLTESGS